MNFVNIFKWHKIPLKAFLIYFSRQYIQFIIKNIATAATAATAIRADLN